jgi:glyoxylase-like metal-dependent hydrolase (beta-lactamase superfamily II)
MKLTKDVYLVGGGVFNGFGLSGNADSHIYAIDGGDEIALIDCGMGTGDSIDRILANIKADGLDCSKIKYIFLTHYHIDHCGGLAEWQERMPIKAFIAAEAVNTISAGSDDRNGLALAKKEGVYPADYLYRAAVIDQGLLTGDSFKVGSLNLSFISTPGHCDGHSSYLLHGERNYLFTGDCLFAGGKIAISNTADCSIDKYRKTILAMSQLEFDALLPGHGSLVLSGGKAHLEIAIAAFNSLTLPRSFL